MVGDDYSNYDNFGSAFVVQTTTGKVAVNSWNNTY